MARGVLPERVVIKIGASALLSGGRPDPVKLAAVADAVVRLRADGIQTVVVGSGAAAVGRTRLAEAGIPVDPTARQPAAAVGQGPLFEAFRDAFEARGLIAAQFPLTPLDLTGPEHGEGVRAALEEALDGGLVPVVNENDAVTGRGGDVLAALVAGSLRAARLLLLTDVPGLSEAGPRQDAVRRVPEIAVMTPEVRRLGGGPARGPGPGGVAGTLCAAWTATLAGVPVVIADAGTQDAVVRAVRGEDIGILVHPREAGAAYDDAYDDSWRIIVRGGRTRLTSVNGRVDASSALTGRSPLTPGRGQRPRAVGAVGAVGAVRAAVRPSYASPSAV
ncbi:MULTISPECIES: hypothetical protein [unclassified Streptomyces]|uniref:amino acid kinase family protein n=1 Tax=unclassified Streptomyces TaxID=2593676 RepID=UPI002E0E06A9|nr:MULTISPECIES: hypothetical protein [unclassified Streptomyces]WSR22544.1 hypothetical protein OG573_27725 [Streptomyces sp. NBC_01205]